jgi:hypothetical protein
LRILHKPNESGWEQCRRFGGKIAEKTKGGGDQ